MKTATQAPVRDWIFLTTWNLVWYKTILAFNQVSNTLIPRPRSSFCISTCLLLVPCQTRSERIKAIRHLLGYWNSVGGVRFWAIATLWWFWCMTSVSGIVVPVKNMFWLKFCVAVHPKQSIETELPIRVQIMMPMDEWWWKSEENKKEN